MSTITPHTTRATGTVLTAAIYNSDHVNHVTNATNLNNDKLEGATPPVVDGHGVAFNGTSGAAIKTLGFVPSNDSLVMKKANNLSDVVSAATSFTNIKQAATTGATGVVKTADATALRAGTTTDQAAVPSAIVSASAAVALTDAATIAVDWATFINATVTLGGNRTLGLPTNGQPGTWRTIQVTQDGTGSRTLAYTAGYKFPGGVAPTLSTAAGAIDRLIIYCRTSSIFEIFTALAIA